MGLRLAPPELDIGEDEGFADDKNIFGRKAFGQGLTNLVKAIEGPAVIALDAPWGAGKTTFLKQWCGDLKKNGIPSIRFDAFANDYKSDAFLALAAEIIGKAQELGVQDQDVAKTFQDTATKVIKRFLRSGLRVGTRALTAGVLDTTDFENAAAAAMRATEKEANAALDDLIAEALTSTKRDEELFDQFRDALGAYAKLMGEQLSQGPQPNSGSDADDKSAAKETGDVELVFIIDELDRCRPDFALDILEKIKHFYNVPGVVFVLSVNIGQLAESVRSAYGHGINASTYLEKFYQWRVQFPSDEPRGSLPCVEKYIRYLLKTHASAATHSRDSPLNAIVAAQTFEFSAFSIQTNDAGCIFCLDQCTSALTQTEDSQRSPNVRVSGHGPYGLHHSFRR